MSASWNVEDHVNGMDVIPPFIAAQTVPIPKTPKIKKSIKSTR